MQDRQLSERRTSLPATQEALIGRADLHIDDIAVLMYLLFQLYFIYAGCSCSFADRHQCHCLLEEQWGRPATQT